MRARPGDRHRQAIAAVDLLFENSGRVTALGACQAGRPLLFYRGRYAATDPRRPDAPAEVVDTLLAWPRYTDWM